MAAARAGAEHADFAADVGQRAQEFICAFKITEHLVVRYAAGGAHLSADIFRRPVAVTEIQIGRNRHVAVVGEFASAFAVPFVPAGRVMDGDHGGKGTGAQGPGDVGIDDVAVMSLVS